MHTIYTYADHAKLLQKVLEGDPAMTLIQLDVKEGNVNDIVNESVRSTYQVSNAAIACNDLPVCCFVYVK